MFVFVFVFVFVFAGAPLAHSRPATTAGKIQFSLAVYEPLLSLAPSFPIRHTHHPHPPSPIPSCGLAIPPNFGRHARAIRYPFQAVLKNARGLRFLYAPTQRTSEHLIFPSRFLTVSSVMSALSRMPFQAWHCFWESPAGGRKVAQDRRPASP